MSEIEETQENSWDVHSAWEKGLRDKYPHLFENYLRGRIFEVGAGWYSIIERTLELMHFLQEKCPENKINIAQIKEKFGGLRIYTDTEGPDEFHKIVNLLVQAAEAECDRACEICGETGKRQGRVYLQTLCEEHTPPIKEKEDNS